MLSAANENVLMAAQACHFERLCPTAPTIARHTSPDLSPDEVRVILRLLVGEDYLRTEYGVISDVPSYVLTERGEAEASRVAALDDHGTPAEGQEHAPDA
jgi:hypothetical protein